MAASSESRQQPRQKPPVPRRGPAIRLTAQRDLGSRCPIPVLRAAEPVLSGSPAKRPSRSASPRLAAHAVLTDQLRASLASRAVTDQVLGVVIAEQRCTAAEAFDILRSASQNRSR